MLRDHTTAATTKLKIIPPHHLCDQVSDATINPTITKPHHRWNPQTDHPATSSFKCQFRELSTASNNTKSFSETVTFKIFHPSNSV